MRGRHRHRHSWFGMGGPGEQEPWGFRGKFFEAGEVRLALLSLLEDEPKHGYELMKELEARSGGMYKASPGSVYPNLQMLEDEGLVKPMKSEDGKRGYAITDTGRAELERNAEGVGRIWSRASGWGDWSDAMTPGAMETWGPAMALVLAAFKVASRGDEETVERVRQALKKAAKEIEALAGSKK